MSAGANRTATPSIADLTFEDAVEEPRPYAFSVGVRTRLGEDLEGLEAHGDGVSFRSPRPIEGGQRVELIICRAILVEAEVVGCAPLGGDDGGFWVRARFHNTSPALNHLICEELNRLMDLAD
jgi:hypothetical protein